MQNRAQVIDPATVKADLAAAERESQFVNQEQIMAAALFAKQLRADLNGIRSAAVGEGLKVGDIDISKVMPSEILKTHRPTGMPIVNRPPERVQLPTEVPPAPVTQTVNMPQMPVQQAQPVIQVNTNNDNQLEFDFDKKARYIEVVEAIERLDKKIATLTAKIEEVYQVLDKKKLNEN